MKTETPFSSKMDRLEKQKAALLARIAELEDVLKQALILIERPTRWEVSGEAWHPDAVKKALRQALAGGKGGNQ